MDADVGGEAAHEVAELRESVGAGRQRPFELSTLDVSRRQVQPAKPLEASAPPPQGANNDGVESQSRIEDSSCSSAEDLAQSHPLQAMPSASQHPVQYNQVAPWPPPEVGFLSMLARLDDERRRSQRRKQRNIAAIMFVLGFVLFIPWLFSCVFLRAETPSARVLARCSLSCATIAIVLVLIVLLGRS
eukprot:Amastigsp_a854715_9.p1 type:complete len:188 gc:universal Amastigsp_a854715_9:123-686(+)